MRMVMIGLTLIGAASAMEQFPSKPDEPHHYGEGDAPPVEQLRRQWNRVDDLLVCSSKSRKVGKRKVMLEEAICALQRELDLFMNQLDQMSSLDSRERIPGDKQEPLECARTYSKTPENNACAPLPPASGWEIAGYIQELRECARSYSEAPEDNTGALRYTVGCIIQDTPEGAELRSEAAQALAPLADANQELYQTLMQKLGAGS